MRSIRRDSKTKGPGQVAPLTYNLVDRICSQAESDTKNPLAGLRDSAIIRLMSDCLLRVSEVAAVNVGDLKDNTLTIRQSKTDQMGEGWVSGHSLRVGSAVSLARGNASLVEMQVDGRWKDSRMPSHYASAEIAKNSATARIKYGKGR